MRLWGDTQRVGFVWSAVAAVMLCGAGQASALGCADIPGATVDLGLASVLPYRSYGRLLPEFTSVERNEESRRAVVIRRLVGKRLVLPDGDGHIWLTLTEAGGTKVSAIIGERSRDETLSKPLAGLDNSEYRGKLARVLFAQGIAWGNFAAPPLPVIDIDKLPDNDNITRVGQSTNEVKGAPLISSADSVKYACSADASYVGDPDKLSTIVVLKGTIRASQTTTTTTTDQILSVTINDDIEHTNAGYDDVNVLLADFPNLLEGLIALQEPVPAEVADNGEPSEAQLAELQTGSIKPPANSSASDQSAAVPAAASRSLPQTPPSGTDPAVARSAELFNWPVVLTALAIILAIVLLFLFHPHFTARKRRDSIVAAEESSTPEESTVSGDEEAVSHVSSTPEQPDKTLDARIAVLETLREESEQFRQKLQQAIETAGADAADTKQVKETLEAIELQLSQVSDAKAKLEETAQDDRSTRNAAQEEARQLKESVVDLKMRLAKVTAQVESSQTVIVELESASRMAIELNADYRDKTREFEGENTALRSRIDLLDSSLNERDDLLQSTIQTNEEIRKALVEERAERASIETDFNELSKDLEALQQDTDTELKELKAAKKLTDQELLSSQEALATLERKLDGTHRKRRQIELDHHADKTENARMRVDHGVKARLLENNVRELSAHIDSLEQLLREHDIEVPDFTTVLPDATAKREELPSAGEKTSDADGKTEQVGANIVRLRPTRKEHG